MDFYSFDLYGDAESGYEFAIVLPHTGKESDAKIKVVGSDSKAYRAAKSAMLTKAATTDSEIEQDDINIYVYSRCIVSWSGFEENGNPVECTQVEVERLFRHAPWLLDQVARQVEKRSNFTKKQEVS